MTDPTNGKKKAGRPKKPPTPPVLGIGERSGPWGKCVIVLGGLVVNGKKYDPQTGADLLADMLEHWLKRFAPARESAPAPSPTLAVIDPKPAEPAIIIDRDGIASPEPAMAPGQNGSY